MHAWGHWAAAPHDEQGLHGLPKLHQHPAPLWDVPPAQPHQHPHHSGARLASLLENEPCMGACSGKGEMCIPSGAECKKPLGPLKPPWGLPLPSLVQLMVAASFHPSLSLFLWLSPARGRSPWQREVTSGCGGQPDRCLTVQETRWCLSVS